MLPGLRSLHKDLVQVAPEKVGPVTSMIRDYEDKLDVNKPKLTDK